MKISSELDTIMKDRFISDLESLINIETLNLNDENSELSTELLDMCGHEGNGCYTYSTEELKEFIDDFKYDIGDVWNYYKDMGYELEFNPFKDLGKAELMVMEYSYEILFNNLKYFLQDKIEEIKGKYGMCYDFPKSIEIDEDFINFVQYSFKDYQFDYDEKKVDDFVKKIMDINKDEMQLGKH